MKKSALGQLSGKRSMSALACLLCQMNTYTLLCQRSQKEQRSQQLLNLEML